MFDIAVDDDGNYIIVGHTTAGAGVVNWDYLALKVGIFKHQSLNHFVYPAKKVQKGNCC